MLGYGWIAFFFFLSFFWGSGARGGWRLWVGLGWDGMGWEGEGFIGE